MSRDDYEVTKAYAEPSYKAFRDLYYMPEDHPIQLANELSAKLAQQRTDILCMSPIEFFDHIAYHTRDEYHDMMQGIADFYRQNMYLTHRQFRAVCKATEKLGLSVPQEATEIRLV